MTARRRLELADVIREHGPQFIARHGGSLFPEQRRVLRDVARCRTAALGGHKLRCEDCAREEISYNSCQNRHCPKCLASARAQWLERERSELLNVGYFHVVFTLPEKLGPIALQNKRELYGVLFRAAAETLLTIARDPKHLGAELGFLMVLHTWGQNLHHHPHVHCVVPGGGLAADRSRWIPCRKRFFLPVRVLSRFFRRRFLEFLNHLYDSGKLLLVGRLVPLAVPQHWQALVAELSKAEWVVYSKPPFGGPEQVLKYLARYTHRVAISNHRLLSNSEGQVRFSWKDYVGGGKRRVMTLEAEEFIRRFLLHVLPPGFVRIRHYGFLSNRSRARDLPIARQLLGQSPVQSASDGCVDAAEQSDRADQSAQYCPRCPRCNGRLIIVEKIPALQDHPLEAAIFNTS